jgi:hypothetical protein
VSQLRCGHEVYGNCTELRVFLEDRSQAYVLRAPSNYRLALAGGAVVTCAQAVPRLLKDKRRWEVRLAGKGSKGDRGMPGLARHRLAAASPADPPPPEDR